ncbi:RICIN domain-containing protein [Streptomyces sp. NPDC003631]
MPPGESDETLATRLRGRPVGEDTQPVALLMARHWQAAHDYAAICLASTSDAASMVTATAFHRILGHLQRSGAAAALRPQLLVAVRDTVREWSAEDRISGVVPALRKPAGGRGMRTAKSLTRENRALAERSFQSLPGLARCLLWHGEVEAEHISVPAVLLGMDSESAAAALEQAREQFRAACVRSHRELAPTDECRYHNRLLDVPMRRGSALLPEVQQHVLECRYCRSAAEQLSHFEGGLGGLLAEAILGWGAHRYLDSRPGRVSSFPRGGGGSGLGGRRAGGGGRHRLLPGVPTRVGRGILAGEPQTRALLTGAGIAAAVAIATLLAGGIWSDDGGADPVATSASGGLTPGADPDAPPAVPSPPDSAGLSTQPQQTRLRYAAGDLCLDIRGTVQSGAGTRLAACSSAWTQQWSYESDGLLRSVADLGLCLDSHATDGVVTLARCDTDEARANDVRYDLTVRGELLPRWSESLAVTPANDEPNADVVVRNRDGSGIRQWATDRQSAQSPSLSIAGTGGPPAAQAPRPPSRAQGLGL